MQNEELCRLADAMRAQPGGVAVRDRTRGLRTLRRTFLGSDAVRWLVSSGHAASSDEAVALGNRLLDAGLLHHAAYEHRLKDSAGLLYRFTADDAALGAALAAEHASASAASASASASAAAAMSPSGRRGGSAGGGRTPSLSAWNGPAGAAAKKAAAPSRPASAAPTAGGRIGEEEGGDEQDGGGSSSSGNINTNANNSNSAAALAAALAADGARHPHRLLVTAQLAALRQRVALLEQAHDEAVAAAFEREEEAAEAARGAARAAVAALREEGEAVARELGRAARASAAEAERLRAVVASLRAAVAAAGAAVLLLAGGMAALAGGGSLGLGGGGGLLASAAGVGGGNPFLWALRAAVPALAAAWAAWSIAIAFARASSSASSSAVAVAAVVDESGGAEQRQAVAAAAAPAPAPVAEKSSGSFDFPGLPAIRTVPSQQQQQPLQKAPSRTVSHGGGVGAFGAATAATVAAVAAALETPRQRARRAASLDAPAPGSPAAFPSSAAGAPPPAAAAAYATPFGAAHHQRQAAGSSAGAAAPSSGGAAHQQQPLLRTVPSASARIQLNGPLDSSGGDKASSSVQPVCLLQPQMTERTAMNTVAAAASAGRSAAYDSTLYAPPTRADFEGGGWRHGPLLIRPHPGVPHMRVLGVTGAPAGSADEREVAAPPVPGDERARQVALARPPPRRLGVNGVVIHFETDAFVGKAMLHIRGLPSSDDSLFAAFKRRSHVVVQGRFKRPLPVQEALTGQEFGRPFEKLPAMWLVEHGLLACARRVSTSSAIGGMTTSPYMLLPLMAAAQIANASRPGEEPDMMAATEDLRAWDPSLVAAHHEAAAAAASSAGAPPDPAAPLPSDARRKLFTRASARASRTLGTDLVWTFHLWQQFIDMSDYTLTVAGAKYDMARHLAGQPLQFLAKTAGGSHLWAFETWNRRLLERAEQAHGDAVKDGSVAAAHGGK